jgi:adenine-specific DNA-methyltransferase
MTELIWEGKYDKDGRKVSPLRVALPFQTVETVNESAQQRQVALDLFGRGRETEWRNRLIWGDKKYVLPGLLAEFAGKVDLIYVDPPFATGDDFSFSAEVPASASSGGASTATFVKQPSVIEQKAYRDTWGVSPADRRAGVTSDDRYLQWFYDVAVLLKELLASTGVIYVHGDYHMGHYMKLVLDEVFGRDNFQNQIVWQRFNFHADARRFGVVTDEILFYSASGKMTWNAQAIPIKETYVASHFRNVDPNGRRYKMADILAKGQGPPRRFGDRTLEPPAGTHWRFGQEKIDQLMEDGRIAFSGQGRPAVKMYLDENQGSAVHNLWTDIPPVNPMALERVSYPTQKPAALLERIIAASSNPGDLVLDCFCGSGTTAVVAEKLGRRWIAADLGRFAIHTTRKRLLAIGPVQPFVVQNLGKYERQLWQTAEFGEGAEARTRDYRSFILRMFRANPIQGYTWLHGVKQGRLVHIGTVDAPVTVGDVRQIATEFRRAIGTGEDAPTTKAVDVLGWDFAFELNEVARQEATRAGIDVHFWRIPREVLETRAVEQGDVQFFELAALAVDVTITQRNVHVSLTDFIIPLDDVPEEVQRAITDWSQWIDYWAIDWDNRSDTFHNEWQTYRTRKEPTLQKSASHQYGEAGEYRIVVKVIDILGNDTTKTLVIEVP